MANLDDLIERLKTWRLLESDIVALPLLILAVIVALKGNVAAASLIGGLFVTVVLVRALPRLKSWKWLGMFEVQLFQQVTEISTTGTAELRTEFQHLNHGIQVLSKALSERQDLPPETIPALQQLNSTATLAGQKLTIVENANTALDALLSKGPVSWVEDGSTVTLFKKGQPILKLGGDPKDKPRSN